jgi:flagellar basal-body rod protein FlgG
VAYTRSGNFHVDSSGKVVTVDGYPVRGASGAALKIDPSLPVEVLPDGTIRQSGQDAGRFTVLDFDDPHALAKMGNSYFRTADPNLQPSASTASVRQGSLEASNVGSAESAVRLVSVMRQFEMLQRAVNVSVEMNKKAVEEVARVNS